MNSGLIMEKYVRPVIKPLGNLGWSPIEKKKFKFVPPMHHIYRSSKISG
jgi:hypothetical protein